MAASGMGTYMWQVLSLLLVLKETAKPQSQVEFGTQIVEWKNETVVE